MKISEINKQKFVDLIPSYSEQEDDLKKVSIKIYKFLDEYIKKIKNKKIGILFSGGIDSSALSYLLKKNNILFHSFGIGFYDNNIEGLAYPYDIEYGMKISNEMKINYKFKIYTFKEIEKEIEKTIKILGIKYPQLSVNIGVGTIERLGIIELKKLNCDYIISGLGSEELFAGYHRHINGNILKNTEKGLKKMYERDITRLKKLNKYYNIEIDLPFLNKELIEFSASINTKLKINKGFEKYCLRKTFENKLPSDVVWRKKKAAQYGSRIDSAIKKLKNKYKFKEKKDYLTSLK